MIKIFLSISKPKRCFRNTEIELLQAKLNCFNSLLLFFLTSYFFLLHLFKFLNVAAFHTSTKT